MQLKSGECLIWGGERGEIVNRKKLKEKRGMKMGGLDLGCLEIVPFGYAQGDKWKKVNRKWLIENSRSEMGDSDLGCREGMPFKGFKPLKGLSVNSEIPNPILNSLFPLAK